MHFAYIRELFSSPVATALCWTLVHSLWQGLLFVISTALILGVTRKSASSLRYKILSGQFVLFILVSAGSFAWELKQQFQDRDTADGFNAVVREAKATDALPVTHTLSAHTYLDAISDLLTDYAPWIVAAWFLIVLLKSIRIVSSLLYTRHLRKHHISQPPAAWNEKLAVFCRQLKISKPVQLLESGILTVPAVFGHLKPVIFIPLGILANMPAQQVEAVLLHELAHIRRNDYLFNLLQNIVETVFFFNPALLWLSSIIREERENCCDDIAIEQTRDKKQFIESLIRFRELYFYSQSKYVTAFPGNKNSFVNRITRIAMNKNKSLNPADNIFLAISLIIISVLVMTFSQAQAPPPPKKINMVQPPAPPVAASPDQKAEETPVPPVPVALSDTLPKNKKVDAHRETISINSSDEYSISSDIDKSAGKETITMKKEGNEYRLVKRNGQIAYLMVNDEKIPQDKMGEYSEILKKINTELERMRKEQAIRDKEQEERDREQKIRDKEQEERNREQKLRDKEQEEREHEQDIRDKEQQQRDAEQEIRNKEQDIRDKEQEKRDAEQKIRDREQEQREKALKKLISDLIDDHIIRDEKELSSFKLSDDGFIVNGVKQDPAIFKKYKARYLPAAGGTYNYRNN